MNEIRPKPFVAQTVLPYLLAIDPGLVIEFHRVKVTVLSTFQISESPLLRGLNAFEFLDATNERFDDFRYPSCQLP